MNKKISIIVPVFNVSKYLEQCMESIVGQSYKNLEIILVDDGSTDDSGVMCDDYADKDERIIVIHKKNGGLSDARNAGLQVATGEYIGFVDSDDWIESDMYERMYSLCEEYGLDMVAARYCEEAEGDCQVNEWTYSERFEVVTGKRLNEIFAMGHEDYVISTSVWDRLYRKELLQDIYFPVGKKYEDICFSTKVFLRVKKAGYLDVPMYHYRIRANSIMGRGKRTKEGFNQDIITDLLPQMRERAEVYYEAGYEEYGDKVLYGYLHEILNNLVVLFRKSDYKKEYSDLRKEFYSYRAWSRKYVRKTQTVREKWILRLSGVCVEAYILFVIIKRRK